jgi:hypothetical protein
MLIIIDSMIVIETSQTLPAMTVKHLDRLFSHLPLGQKDECWEWQGYRNGRGYGKMTVFTGNKRNRNSFTAHRLVYRFFNQKDPGELFVCHKCDNPACCNPYHLFLGTSNDNTQDKIKKGRGTWGESSLKNKLTAEQVLEIRRRDKEVVEASGIRSALWKQMAVEYDVKLMTIQYIVYGRTWKQLLPEGHPGRNRNRRTSGIKSVGENHHMAKLNTEKVVAIREAFHLRPIEQTREDWYADVAKQYGVHSGTIKYIIQRNSWKHI